MARVNDFPEHRKKSNNIPEAATDAGGVLTFKVSSVAACLRKMIIHSSSSSSVRLDIPHSAAMQAATMRLPQVMYKPRGQ
jgi:hypothetical protein